MPLSTEDFTSQVEDEVNFLHQGYTHSSNNLDDPFTQYVLQLLFPSVDADLAFNLLTQDRSEKVDATYKDEDSGTFYLISTRYTLNPTEKEFGSGLIYPVLDRRKTLLRENKIYKDEQGPFSDAIEAHQNGYDISVIIAVFGDFSSRINEESIRNEYSLKKQDLILCGLDQLRRYAAGFEGEIVEATLNLPILSSANYSGEVEALVCNVDAKKFSSSVDQHIPDIYDANLRVPLGYTKINKQMEETLDSKEDRRYFWFYNNGITLLCKDFNKIEDETSIEISSPRIVNGAQTTDALVNSTLPEGEVGVMVRVISALPGAEEDLEDGDLEDLYLDIAKYTNSQNPIKVPDFRSNEKVQKEIHRKLKKMGWFYEHRRGQWDRNKIKEYGTDRHIKMVDLAQRWFAFDGHPATAIRKKQSLFEERGHYASIFKMSRDVKSYLVAYKSFGLIRKKLGNNVSDAKESIKNFSKSEDNIPFPSRNYIMIGRATKLAASHMTALLGRELRNNFGSLDDSGVLDEVYNSLMKNKLIEKIYPELEDTLFRFASTLQGEESKSMHKELSNEETFDGLYGLFQYVLDREKSKGRNIFDSLILK